MQNVRVGHTIAMHHRVGVFTLPRVDTPSVATPLPAGVTSDGTVTNPIVLATSTIGAPSELAGAPQAIMTTDSREISLGTSVESTLTVTTPTSFEVGAFVHRLGAWGRQAGSLWSFDSDDDTSLA
jgi:hypothetical protein